VGIFVKKGTIGVRIVTPVPYAERKAQQAMHGMAAGARSVERPEGKGIVGRDADV
jgi:hypothetical protein